VTARRLRDLDGQALRKARHAAGLSQHQLALECGLSSDSLLSRWERDVASPRPATLKVLAERLGVPIVALQPMEVRERPDLRAERFRRGWSMRELAEMTGIPVPTLVSLERGTIQRRPHGHTVSALSIGLGVREEDVLDLIARARELAGGVV